MFTIPSLFIGIFKIGDNINYNLEILRNLYEVRESAPIDKKKYFNKLIVVTNVSIIEACLYDFHKRVTNNTSESVRNVALNVVQYIKGKEIDQFESLIASSRKHKLFESNDNFYTTLDDLRKARNRIHIQNKKWLPPNNEEKLFTNRLLIKSEQALEYTMKILNNDYSRDDSYGYVEPFQIPWKEHFTSEQVSGS